MRVFGTILFLAFLSIPLAAADQDVSAGPARVTTFNGSWGDGCDGANGGAQRDARVRVDDPRGGNGYKEAVVGSWCTSYDDGTNEFTGSGLYVYAISYEWNNVGPAASYGWYGGSANGERSCTSYATSADVFVYLGCPSPDGSAPPMLPALP